MNLHELVEAEDIEGLRQAIAAGGNPNQSFPDSDECLLSTAAQAGQAGMVRLLLELGATPNIRKTVTPPLTAAVRSGSLECVQAIIEADAEIDVKDEDGSTPLMDAAAGGHLDIVQVLLDRGANPKLKDRYKNTALSVAADKNHPEVCDLLMHLATPKEQEKATVRLELHSQQEDEQSVLNYFEAAIRGRFDDVCRIVQGGFAPDAIDGNGTSALMWAANKDHMEIVCWLLEKGAKVNRKSVYGETPLSYAAMGCHPEMYDYLYPLTERKLRKRAEKIKQNQIDIGNWPAES